MESDLGMALELQEQENTLDHCQLPPVASDDGDYSSSSSVFSYDEDDYQFFEGREGPEDEEVDETSQSDINMEDDDIDPDDMSYEELLALGEIVGAASRGLTDEQISSCLVACKWHSSKSKTITDMCVVCQMEYEEGEKLVGLIACAHPYHADCISQWLQVKKACPICNTEVSPSVPTS
uniref:RING-type domain-containing protein n=1 Tax=Kalanchoe fedtschenkoi TaxID=63787 RepID=A0A7N0TNB1_KALFE